MSFYQETIRTITQSKLSDKEKLIAFTLLDLAHADNGFLNTTWGQLQKVMGNVAVKTVKNRLGLLVKAGIIHYSSNETVDITFEAWRGGRSLSRLHGTTVPAPRDDTHPGYTGLDNLSRPHGTTVPATRDYSPGFSPTPPRVGELIPSTSTSTSTSTGTENTLTPTPAQPEPAVEPEPEERERTAAMLRELGVAKADDLAPKFGFRHCRDHALAWLEDRRKNPSLSPGVLVHRIKKASAPAPSATSLLRSDFALRWRVAGEGWTDTDKKWAEYDQARAEETPDDAHQDVVASEAQAAPIGPESAPDGHGDTNEGVVVSEEQGAPSGSDSSPDRLADANGSVVAKDAVWAGVKDILRDTRLRGTVDRLALRSLNGRAVVVCNNAQTQYHLSQSQWAGMVEGAFQKVTGAPVPVEFVVEDAS